MTIVNVLNAHYALVAQHNKCLFSARLLLASDTDSGAGEWGNSTGPQAAIDLWWAVIIGRVLLTNKTASDLLLVFFLFQINSDANHHVMSTVDKAHIVNDTTRLPNGELHAHISRSLLYLCRFIITSRARITQRSMNRRAWGRRGYRKSACAVCECVCCNRRRPVDFNVKSNSLSIDTRLLLLLSSLTTKTEIKCWIWMCDCGSFVSLLVFFVGVRFIHITAII